MTTAGADLIWSFRDRVFDLSARTLVMGVINVTPDSFSDGGRFVAPGAAIAHARQLMAEGADLLDLGAESTRPGAEPVTASEQIRRLAPVIGALAADPQACLAVDTADAEVADRALELGAQVVNDVTALADPGMAAVVARRGAGLILMHMTGTPATMQQDPRYGDVAQEVRGHLAARFEAARTAGVPAERIVLDPGIGFGKTVQHNFELLARLEEFKSLGRPLLIGVSRKSFLGRTLDLPVDQRLEGGLAAGAVAVFLGARILRTHDVAATVRAVRIADALREARRHEARKP